MINKSTGTDLTDSFEIITDISGIKYRLTFYTIGSQYRWLETGCRYGATEMTAVNAVSIIIKNINVPILSFSYRKRLLHLSFCEQGKISFKITSRQTSIFFTLMTAVILWYTVVVQSKVYSIIQRGNFFMHARLLRMTLSLIQIFFILQTQLKLFVNMLSFFFL